MKFRFLLSSVAMLFSVQAFGAGKPLVIGVEDIEYFPHYSVKNGKYSGYAEEFFTKFAKKNGYEVTYKPMPVNRLFQALLKKEVDLKYPDNPMWQGDSKKGIDVKYSEAVADYIDGVMVKPENKDKGVDQVKNIGTVRGFTPFALLDLIKAGKLKVQENSNFSSLISQAILGRVDGAFGCVANVNYALEHDLKKPGALVFNDKLPFNKSNYLASSVKSPDVVTQINAFLVSDKKEIDDLKKKYGL